MAAEQRKDIIRAIQEKRGGSRVICCLTSDRENAQGVMAKDFLFRFFQHLRTMQGGEKSGKLEKLDVFLFTLGGDTLAAYALSRLVRQFAKNVGVLVPHFCLSGGTLFSLGANEIVMTRLAMLSAIDPSITGLWNPSTKVVQGMPGVPGQDVVAPVGVESVAGFKKLVRDEWHLDEEGSANAFNLLAQKVNPVLLGDLQRSKEQIIRLATTLMKLHSSETDRIKNVVETLATGLGSHDYLIGVEEARNEVKMYIADENPEVEELVLRLYEDFSGEMELGIPFNPATDIQAVRQPTAQPAGASKTLKVVMIESLEKQDVWEREFVSVAPGQVQIKRNHWRR